MRPKRVKKTQREKKLEAEKEWFQNKAALSQRKRDITSGIVIPLSFGSIGIFMILGPIVNEIKSTNTSWIFIIFFSLFALLCLAIAGLFLKVGLLTIKKPKKKLETDKNPELYIKKKFSPYILSQNQSLFFKESIPQSSITTNDIKKISNISFNGTYSPRQEREITRVWYIVFSFFTILLLYLIVTDTIRIGPKLMCLIIFGLAFPSVILYYNLFVAKEIALFIEGQDICVFCKSKFEARFPVSELVRVEFKKLKNDTSLCLYTTENKTLTLKTSTVYHIKKEPERLTEYYLQTLKPFLLQEGLIFTDIHFTKSKYSKKEEKYFAERLYNDTLDDL